MTNLPQLVLNQTEENACVWPRMYSSMVGEPTSHITTHSSYHGMLAGAPVVAYSTGASVVLHWACQIKTTSVQSQRQGML